MSNESATITAAVPANVKAEAAAVAAAHGMSMAALLRELLARVAARDFGRLSGHMASTDWRLIDRRLQALRKAGAVEYVDRYWRVCPSKIAQERTT